MFLVVGMFLKESSQLEKCVEGIVEACGYKLYDLDLPRSSLAILRIYITKPGVGGASAVKLEDCVAVNKALDQSEEFLTLLPERSTVEVSSPGVNRRLRNESQFREALGERVKVTLNSGAHGGVLKGVLREVSSQEFKVEEEKTKELVQIAWSEMRKAQVDFVW